MDIYESDFRDEIQSKTFNWLIALIFVSIIFLVALCFWLYLNIQASMQVDAEQANIRLPKSLPVKIDINNGVDAHAIGEVATEILVDQTMQLPLKGQYPTQLAFNVTTPIKVDIDYKTEILIDAVMPLQATTDLVYQSKFLPEFPLKLDIPLNLKVPFHLKRSYEVPVNIDFNSQVQLDLDEKLNLNVNHVFKPKLYLNDPLEMKNISQFSAVLENVETQTQADIKMHIDLPLALIRN